MDKILLKIITEKHDVLRRKWLATTFENQLADQGITDKPALVEALVTGAFDGTLTETFTWSDAEEDGPPAIERPPLKLSITDNDLREFKRMEEDVFSALPRIINDASKETAKRTVRDLKRAWPGVSAHREYEREQFLDALHSWWRKPLALLRMLQVLAVEEAQDVGRRMRRSRAKKNLAKRDVQFRLHVRICQVADEILTLLESGFADGAMARWRTLHELVVVALLIFDNDDDLAQRYLDHEYVEAWRAAELYQRTRVPIGDEPISEREMAAIKNDRDAMVAKYEKSFAGHYGWAAHHLNEKAPTFEHIEEAAGRVDLRSHYKMASYNVHAGPNGIAFRHSAGGDANRNPAGASMYGLEEAGVNTAHALSQAMMVLNQAHQRVADHVKGWSILMIRDETVRAFLKAAKAVGEA